jgi:hypothetical protein
LWRKLGIKTARPEGTSAMQRAAHHLSQAFSVVTVLVLLAVWLVVRN